MATWQDSPSTATPLNAANLSAAFAEKVDGAVAAATYVPLTDARLTDARTPLAHVHAQSDVTGLVAALASVVVTAPTAYTPVLTAATTNPTLGTGGAARGRYIQVGKLVTYWYDIDFGTSGANAGSGEYSISLPVTAATLLNDNICAGGVFIKSAGLYTQCQSVLAATTTLRILYSTAVAGGTLQAVAHNLPGAFTNSDRLRGYITYEAAS